MVSHLSAYPRWGTLLLVGSYTNLSTSANCCYCSKDRARSCLSGDIDELLMVFWRAEGWNAQRVVDIKMRLLRLQEKPFDSIITDAKKLRTRGY